MDEPFGSERSGGRRLHAACDLIAPKGTPIRAIEDGVVIEGPKPFYSGTYSLVVRHQSGVVRYGEIDSSVPDEVRPGAAVKAGQVIAKVGQLESGSSMLHFELYAGDDDWAADGARQPGLSATQRSARSNRLARPTGAHRSGRQGGGSQLERPRSQHRTPCHAGGCVTAPFCHPIESRNRYASTHL
jgi:murein DD-endopeptidase MepM/ murein hydrolase activator NlpD